MLVPPHPLHSSYNSHWKTNTEYILDPTEGAQFAANLGDFLRLVETSRGQLYSIS
jgi:hypothetical protein